MALIGMFVMLALVYALPLFFVEKLASRAAGKHAQVRLTSFLVTLIAAGLWIGYVFLIDGRRDFSHAQVIASSLTTIALIAGLTCLAHAWGVRGKIAVSLVTGYSAFATGVAFALTAFNDETGLWGVGLIAIALFSLLGFGIISLATTAVLNRQS